MRSNRNGGRRSFLNGAAALGAGFWADHELEALPQNVNTNSKPSDLRITDPPTPKCSANGSRLAMSKGSRG